MPRATDDRAVRPRLARATSGIALFASIAVGGSLILVNSSSAQSETIQTVAPQVDQVLAPVDTGARVETFLLVGSDSREGADPNAMDFGSMGDTGTTAGHRSDTMMILRHDKETGEAAILSLPRDLWVKVPGLEGRSRLNAAFTIGTDTLISVIQKEIGVKVNHYVEVDFNGFATLVDELGGVEACFWYPTRDKHTGLIIKDKGCWMLSGVEARQYVRSRYFEEFRDGKWRVDDRFDLGRIARQQQFMLDALRRAEEQLASNPFILDNLVAAASSSLTVDKTLDLFKMAHRFRDLSPKNVFPYTLPNHPETVNGNDVLVIDKAEAKPIIDYFNGLAPAPDPAELSGS